MTLVMNNIFVTSNSSPAQPATGKTMQDFRRAVRQSTKLHGRIGYGGSQPGLVGCEILDLSETGVRVETFIQLDDLPETLSVEICGVYNRARLCWVSGNQMGLAFITEDTQYLDTL
jgi:hypothetical protein